MPEGRTTALITPPPAVTSTLTELATRIDAAHRATGAAASSALASAIAAGDMLAEARAQLPHGEWLPWLEQNTSVPARIASLYMRLAKHRVGIGNGLADLTVRAATATLAASKRSIAAPASKAKTPPPPGEPKPKDCERLTVSDEESVRAGHMEKGRISKKGGAFQCSSIKNIPPILRPPSYPPKVSPNSRSCIKI